MNSLLSPELYNITSGIPVVRRLPVPARPGLKVDKVEPGQLVTSSDITNKSIVLGTDYFPGGEAVSAVDKAQPHAKYDLMLISSGNEQKPGFAEHSDEFIARTLNLAALFVENTSMAGLNPVVAWSYDPYTDDRATGQGEKRFHAHLMARTQEEMHYIATNATTIGELDSKSRRRIAEESSTVGGLVLYDQLSQAGRDWFLEFQPPLTSEASSLSLQAVIPGGWNGLRDHRFIRDFREIDYAIHAYDNLIRSTVALPNDQGHWKRPEIRPDYRNRANALVETLGLQSEIASFGLYHYLASLRPGLITDIECNKGALGSDYINHVYPLRSTSYTTCITEVNGRLVIHFRFNLFTDLGGPGTSMVGGTPVKIKKSCGMMDPEDLEYRTQSQNHFMKTAGIGNQR